MTINRFCSSGLNAVSIAADRIRVGEADIMIAGGTESMSLIPMLGRLAINEKVFAGDETVGIAYGMGLTAENVATQWKVSREDQDAFALASHQKAIAAQAARRFQRRDQRRTRSTRAIRTLPPAACANRAARSPTTKARAPTRRSTIWRKLKPVFAAKGSVTAGNSSQTSDGAGAAILVSERVLKELALAPLARFAGFAVAGVPPDVMGIGPIAAIPKVLARTGIGQQQLDWIELNEAFAAQALAVIRNARPRSGQGQSAGRRDRARPSARRHRRDPHGDDRARLAQAQAEVRHGDDVHRHRHGRGGIVRGAVGRAKRAVTISGGPMKRLLTMLVALAFALPASALDIHGVKLADKADVGGHALVLNGAGTRTKVVFKIYVGSLYLPQPAKDLAQVLAQPARRVRMDLLRNLSADQLSDALLEGLKENNSDAQLAAVKGETAEMVAAMKGFGDVKQGSVVTLDFVDGTTRIVLDDKLHASIAGTAFNDALMRMWLGEHPVQADLKAAMLGGPPS